MNSVGPFRFGVFELDPRARELRKRGIRVKLQDQPLRLLALLLERRGEVVTREELRELLWPADTFVDFDHGLNKAVNKLREALGDSAESPRFIETVPRRGYRFLPDVEGPTADETAEAARLASENPSRRHPLLVVALGALPLAFGLYWFLRSAPPSAQLPSGKIMLAVLPFEDLGDDPSQSYFSEGMTEEMISALSRLQPRKLGIIARTSAMQYKNSGKRIDQIGAELNVDYVLEGTVRRAGNRVRIAAQLIQVSDQTHLWAENYERELADVFEVQSDVARRIARSLAVELLPERQLALSEAPTTSAAAHEAYLKGRYHWNRRTEEGLRKSLDYFLEAARLDPKYAEANVGIADAYNMLADYGVLAPEDALPRATTAALAALDIDPENAEAFTALTWARWLYDLDWERTETDFQRAIDLNPAYATSYQLYAHYLRALGRQEDALVQARLARELDPLSLILNAVVGWHYVLGRDPDRAIEQCLKTMEIDPSFSRVHAYLGWAYLQKGRYPEAVAELEKARELFGPSPARDAELAHAYAVAGRANDARKIEAELEELGKTRYIEPELLAKIHVGLDDPDRAFYWLERALSARSVKRVMLKVDPLFDPLRSDPRFHDLLRRVGLAEKRSTS